MAEPSHSGATAEISDGVPSQEGAAQIEIPVAACEWRIHKSRGNRRLVQPATVLLPAIRSKAYRRRTSARVWQASF